MRAANDNPMPTGDRLMGIGLIGFAAAVLAIGALALARQLGGF